MQFKHGQVPSRTRRVCRAHHVVHREPRHHGFARGAAQCGVDARECARNRLFFVRYEHAVHAILNQFRDAPDIARDYREPVSHSQQDTRTKSFGAGKIDQRLRAGQIRLQVVALRFSAMPARARSRLRERQCLWRGRWCRVPGSPRLRAVPAEWARRRKQPQSAFLDSRARQFSGDEMRHRQEQRWSAVFPARDAPKFERETPRAGKRRAAPTDKSAPSVWLRASCACTISNRREIRGRRAGCSTSVTLLSSGEPSRASNMRFVAAREQPAMQPQHLPLAAAHFAAACRGAEFSRSPVPRFGVFQERIEAPPSTQSQCPAGRRESRAGSRRCGTPSMAGSTTRRRMRNGLSARQQLLRGCSVV